MSALPLKVANVQKAFDEFNQNAETLMQRPEAQEEVKKNGLDKELLTQKEKTYKWRIQFTSANVYHVNRWRQMRGGKVFYSSRAGKAAVRSLPVNWDFRTNLRSHPYPVYFINGDHDYTDPSCGRNAELLGQMSNAKTVALKDAGHNPWIDDPEGLRKILFDAFHDIFRR